MSWLLRARHVSQPMDTGEFGNPNPVMAEVAQTMARPSASLYSYHAGDIFLPGADRWVFEPNFELPLVTIWGNAFIRNPNTFSPIQPPQVWSHPNVMNNGIGGLQAGELSLEPLINPEGIAAPFQGDFAIPLNYTGA